MKFDKADASQHDLLKAYCTCGTARARHKTAACNKNRRPDYKDAQGSFQATQKEKRKKET